MLRTSFFRWVTAGTLAVGGAPHLPGEGLSPELKPAAAYIMKLAAAPGNDRLLYAATHGSGLYRSVDAGDTWEDISPVPSLRHYHLVVFDPRDPSRLYTGGRDSGLWSSADGGATWAHVAFAQTSILSLAIDPTDSARLYVLTPDGVHRSTTGAAGPWEHVFNYPAFIAQRFPEVWPDPEGTVAFTRFQHLTLNPHFPATLYLGARWEGGYHRSTDGGSTWHQSGIGPLFRRADRIVPHPTHPAILYAETHHQGMFKSFDRGQSWVSSSHGIAPQKRTPHYGAVLISGSAFAPTDPDVIYAGSDYSNWRSSDAGSTWTEVGESLTCEFARSFLVTSQAVYAGTNVGIFRSFDEGATWAPAYRGLPTRPIVASTVGTVDGQAFEFAITAGRPAVFRRPLTAGSAWRSISWLLYETATAIRFDAASETLIITTPAGERRSRDAGLRWDGPTTAYVPTSPESPPPPPLPPDAPPHLRAVAIHGAPAPDDSSLAPMYQRPPYVALAVVTAGYPADGSEPLWTGHWERNLAGLIELPPAVLSAPAPLELRVEVRDFQYGTRTGSSPLGVGGPIRVVVEL